MRPKKVILCVDDNEQELSVMKFMLVTNGYRVLAAKNGQEAIELFVENAVDLVLADFSMPQMSGDQLQLTTLDFPLFAPNLDSPRQRFAVDAAPTCLPARFRPA